MKVVYNPAPMDSRLLQAIRWEKVTVLIVNETEALGLLQLLGGVTKSFPSDPDDYTVESWTQLANKLSQDERLFKTDWIVVTLGSKGSLAVQPNGAGNNIYSPAATPPAPLQDTTGAGDTFLGYLVSHLSSHADSTASSISKTTMEEAIKVAAAASALAVARPGAMQSIPSFSEVVESFPEIVGTDKL